MSDFSWNTVCPMCHHQHCDETIGHSIQQIREEGHECSFIMVIEKDKVSANTGVLLKRGTKKPCNCRSRLHFNFPPRW